MIKLAILLSFLLGFLFGFSQPETDKKATGALAYVARYKDGKTCAISYTFDDGLQEHYTLVSPQLEKHGFKGTFWVWSKCVDNDSANGGKPRMTWAQLNEMAGKGHEISNHSWSHPSLTRISVDSLKVEIERNDSVLFERLGRRPRTFCYPANAMNKTVVEMASKNRVGTRTFQTAVGSKATEESLDDWMKALIEKGDWGVTMTHGITYGHDAFRDPDVLWQHFEKIKAKSDSVWVGTFEEVAAYIKERENIQLNIEEKGRSVSITPHLLLDKELFSQSLTMIVNRKGAKDVEVKQGRNKLAAKVLPDKILFDFYPYGETIWVRFNEDNEFKNKKINSFE